MFKSKQNNANMTVPTENVNMNIAENNDDKIASKRMENTKNMLRIHCFNAKLLGTTMKYHALTQDLIRQMMAVVNFQEELADAAAAAGELEQPTAASTQQVDDTNSQIVAEISIKDFIAKNMQAIAELATDVIDSYQKVLRILASFKTAATLCEKEPDNMELLSWVQVFVYEYYVLQSSFMLTTSPVAANLAPDYKPTAADMVWAYQNLVAIHLLVNELKELNNLCNEINDIDMSPVTRIPNYEETLQVFGKVNPAVALMKNDFFNICAIMRKIRDQQMIQNATEDQIAAMACEVVYEGKVSRINTIYSNLVNCDKIDNSMYALEGTVGKLKDMDALTMLQELIHK